MGNCLDTIKSSVWRAAEQKSINNKTLSGKSVFLVKIQLEKAFV